MIKKILVISIFLIVLFSLTAIPEESSSPIDFENITLTTPEPEKEVKIYSSAKSVMKVGEKVILTSKLIGFDGYEIRYQWECNKGSGFKDIEGANSSSYEFSANAETLSWSYRLTVYYK